MRDTAVNLAVETARLAVAAAAEASLRHFRKGVAVEIKTDRTPVTQADRDSEAAILEVIEDVYPGHAILSEERGLIGKEGTDRWIVDPLDGTRGFARGAPFWGPLVALESGGEIVAGAMALPALGETYWAGRGIGCFGNGRSLRVSEVEAWSECTLQLGEMRALWSGPHARAVAELTKTAASARCFGDLAGCAQLLSGRADVWIESGVRIWDLAPLLVLVEEAGGTFTDLEGARTVASGSALATNGRLHDHALAALGG